MRINKITNNTNINFKNNILLNGNEPQTTEETTKNLNSSIGFQKHKEDVQFDNLTARKNPFKRIKDNLHKAFSSLTDDVEADSSDYNKMSEGYLYVLA